MKISVIIPTCRRDDSLRRCLISLEKQTFPRDQFEVIVIVDGSEPGTLALLKDYAGGLRLRFEGQPSLGPGPARNRGAAMAAGFMLLFLDDDMEPEPELLEAHWRRTGAIDSVGIGNLVTKFERQPGFLGFGMRIWWERKLAAARKESHRFSNLDLLSGHFSIRAETFRRIGGFDASFSCREDYEFGARLIKADIPFQFVGGASAIHHETECLRKSLNRAFEEGRADVDLARRHPELIPVLPLVRFSAGRNVRSAKRRAAEWVIGCIPKYTERLLPLIERIGLRTVWHRVFVQVRCHWYRKGAEATSGNLDELRKLLAQRTNTPRVEIELNDELDFPAEQATETSTCELQLRFRGQPIGILPAVPLGESIRPEHVKGFVRENSWAFLIARTLGCRSSRLAEGRSKPKASPELKKGRGRIWVGEIEVSHLDGSILVPVGFDFARVLIRSDTVPVGWVELKIEEERREFPVEAVRDCIARQLGNELLRNAVLREFIPEPAGPTEEAGISVIICTRDRPNDLSAALESVLAQNYGNFEVVVVDNAPTDARTHAVVRRTRAHYVLEPRPGLDHARNRGLAVARHDIVAFIDDDARADSHWLKNISRAFCDSEVMGVTGLVLPGELDTDAQVYFERVYGGMGKGFVRRSIHRDSLSSRDLLWASSFGVGTNMAFRRSVFKDIGMFDPALDVGTPTRGGGDVELLHRLVAHGHLLRYEPEIIVWHRHRREEADLRRQIFNNGCSVIPFLLTCVRNKTVNPHAAAKFLAIEIVGWWLLKRWIRPRRHSRSLVFAESCGLVSGAFAYHKSRKIAKELVGQSGGDQRTNQTRKPSPASAAKTEVEGCAAL